MGYQDGILTMTERKYASQFNQRFPWFVYTGPATENQILKWKAYNPGSFPAPHAEIYQAYAVDRYAQEIKDRIEYAGGVMLWGSIEGMELVKTEKQLEVHLNGKTIAFFWYGTAPTDGWLKHGDMGTFGLFRMGYMVGDVVLDDYLLTENDKLQLAMEQAEKKLELPAYKGNPKAFTTDTGFLVVSMDLEPQYNNGIFIGYKSVMNVDWSQQVLTTKNRVSTGPYGSYSLDKILMRYK